MILKNNVKIQGIPYTVSYEDPDGWAEGGMGRCDVKKAKIRIASSMQVDQQAVTLLHEVLHALSDALAIGLKEEQVEALSSGLYPILEELYGREE